MRIGKLAIALVPLVCAANHASAAAYGEPRITPLSSLADAYAFGVNNNLPPLMPGGGSQVIGGGVAGQALLWDWSTGSVVDLQPAGFNLSTGYGVGGNQQVGYGSPADGKNSTHALLWHGSSGTAIDINPTNLPGFDKSTAYGTDGIQQVGIGFQSAVNNLPHALLWNGTADSAVDLSPSGYNYSDALSVCAGVQVGYGSDMNDAYHLHALLWRGTASSVVDLGPTGFNYSFARGIYGNQQVGDGDGPVTGNDTHALVWTGSADSFVDLNPTGASASTAYATNGSEQAGNFQDFTIDRYQHACVWFGTADSFMELPPLQPEDGNWKNSYAYSIDAAGDVFGTASRLNDSGGSDLYAVEWPVAVPEPASWLGFGLLMLGEGRRRRVT